MISLSGNWCTETNTKGFIYWFYTLLFFFFERLITKWTDLKHSNILSWAEQTMVSFHKRCFKEKFYRPHICAMHYSLCFSHINLILMLWFVPIQIIKKKAKTLLFDVFSGLFNEFLQFFQQPQELAPCQVDRNVYVASVTTAHLLGVGGGSLWATGQG